MKKSVFLSVITAISLTAAEVKEINMFMPFAGYISYGDKSVKDKGFYGGIHLNGKTLDQQVDIQYSYLKLDYQDNTPALGQNDFSLVYSNFGKENYIFKGGVHYIDSDDYLTDEGLIFFGGVKYYKIYDFDVGIEGYYSTYRNFSPTLNVWQLTPSVGKYLHTQRLGDFYLNLQYFYITFKESRIIETVNNNKYGVTRHTIKSVADYDNNNHSVQFSLTNYYGKFTTTGYVWGGKQAYAVRDGGFTVYNLAEVHKGGGGFIINYQLKNSFGISFNVAYEKFTDTETSEDTNVLATGISLNYVF